MENIITFLPKVLMVCIHLSRSSDLCISNSVCLLIVDNDKNLLWHSPNSWDLSSAIMSIEVLNKDAVELSKILESRYNIYLRPFSKPLNALRVSPNMFNSIQEIERLLKLVTKQI